LYNTLCEEDPTEWTKEQILDHIEFDGSFTSFKFNRIASLIPDLFNQICPTDLSGFRTDLTGQNTLYSQAMDHNTPVNQNMDQVIPVVQVTDPQTVYLQATYLQAAYLQTTDLQVTDL